MRQIHFAYWDILGRRAGTSADDPRTIFRLPADRFFEIGIQTDDYFDVDGVRYQVIDVLLVDPTMAELSCEKIKINYSPIA